MKRNSNSMGALHPILFFVFIYGISLFLALFVCRTVYYSLNDTPSAGKEKMEMVQQDFDPRATALR